MIVRICGELKISKLTYDSNFLPENLSEKIYVDLKEKKRKNIRISIFNKNKNNQSPFFLLFFYLVTFTLNHKLQ